jgi:CheY-like chemotaxis protein
VLIYENFAVRVRAQRFFERLARGLSRTLKEQMWGFGVLGIRQARNVAGSAARGADAVAVAVSGQRDLPGTIRGWLDMWLWLLEDEKPPLIVLFDSPAAPEFARIHAHLGCIAARAGIDFFSAQRQVSMVPVVGAVGPHDDEIWPASVEQDLIARLSPRFVRQDTHNRPERKLVKFRNALVIEEAEILRSEIVDFLKKQGWAVHGVRRTEQALPLMKLITYQLVVIDCEMRGLAAIACARHIQVSSKQPATPLVLITRSLIQPFTSRARELGALLARRSNWEEDLSTILNRLGNPIDASEREERRP